MSIGYVKATVNHGIFLIPFRVTQKSGFLQSHQQSAIDIQNAQSFRYLLQSLQVFPIMNRRQLVILIITGPRFALVTLWYFLSARPNSQSSLPAFLFGVGIFRTVSCGGWTYVTSTDDHDWHDIFMISYLVATLPWTLGCLALSPPNPVAIKWRKRFGGAFFATLIPLIYYFIQHKVHRVAGGKCTKHWTFLVQTWMADNECSLH
jgi:hypothetical protein